MINYYIASDYQKIVRDIIFYMYLISVHFETYALAGPNAELFYGDEFQLHANSQIEGQDYAWKKSLGLFAIGLRRCPRFHRREGITVTHSRRSGHPCSTALELGQYIRKSYQHVCQHCFNRNMRFFFFLSSAYLLLFNTFAWETMAGLCLISVMNFIFDITLFHTPNINQAFISPSHWNLLDKKHCNLYCPGMICLCMSKGDRIIKVTI